MTDEDYLEQTMTDQDYWEALCRFTDRCHMYIQIGYSRNATGYICDNADDLRAAIRQMIYEERGE